MVGEKAETPCRLALMFPALASYFWGGIIQKSERNKDGIKRGKETKREWTSIKNETLHIASYLWLRSRENDDEWYQIAAEIVTRRSIDNKKSDGFKRFSLFAQLLRRGTDVPSMLPVSSATRALMRATRDSIAAEKSVYCTHIYKNQEWIVISTYSLLHPRLQSLRAWGSHLGGKKFAQPHSCGAGQNGPECQG